MNLLITTADIREIRPIAQAIDDINKVEPFIAEAQQVELKDLLGVEFFYAVLASPDSYQTLLSGGTYNTSQGHAIAFNGLKTVLAYFSYARFLMNDNMKHTNAGFVNKVNQFSQPASQSQITAKYQDARSMAFSHWSDVILYLDTNRQQYPLWRSGCTTKTNNIRSTARISAVNNRDHSCRK
ncbi:DUF6712 family protein [Pedobacter sp. SYP-B3415]|uniref:DUF6712 family protein n=1 Tax=Pedobacter sp. SYP-B3415 TaxID=2496641 RepID=UPI00101CBC00|nr:DUF6712 family protein [Pedobacter sp. SYP-B3415]